MSLKDDEGEVHGDALIPGRNRKVKGGWNLAGGQWIFAVMLAKKGNGIMFEDEIHKVQRWRNRAEECRVDAETMHDEDAIRTLMDIAAVYDRLADRTEVRLGIQSGLEDQPAKEEE